MVIQESYRVTKPKIYYILDIILAKTHTRWPKKNETVKTTWNSYNLSIPRYMKTPISHPLWVIRINAVWLGRLKTLYFVIKRKENKPGIPKLCLQTKCTADSGINVNKQCCPGWSLSYSSQKLEFVNKDF